MASPFVQVPALVRADVPVCTIAEQIDCSFIEVLEFIREEKVASPPHPGKPPKLPLGKGYTKPEMTRAAAALRSYPGTLAEWARAEGLVPDFLYLALAKYEMSVAVAEDEFAECPYCTRTFVPTNASQTFCTTKCSRDARRDASYFGGNRRKTLGLLAGICQCCGTKPQKGISSHHVLGKEHDPHNEVLIAVCAGCHDLITRLSRRRFGLVPGSWAALLTLATVRDGRAQKVRVEEKLVSRRRLR